MSYINLYMTPPDTEVHKSDVNDFHTNGTNWFNSKIYSMK
jgi:hypothetical protein